MWLLCLTTMFPCMCFAQSLKHKQLLSCMDKAKTQFQMDVCANQEAKRAEAELNRVYGEAISRSKTYPLATSKLKKAEQIWVAYRKAYLEAMFPQKDKQAVYGTMFPMEADLEFADMTWRQAAALNHLLKQWEETEP